MKYFLTASALLLSFLVAAQFPPNIPYNPDENGDGLIGVADLQALLANYGQEFSSTVISEDGENAVTYMGDMAYPLCVQACRNLPGMWKLAGYDDLGLVWDDLFTGTYNTWVDEYDRFQNALSASNSQTSPAAIYFSTSAYSGIRGSSLGSDAFRCYCAAKQLPRVEYSYCLADGAVTNVNGSGNESALFQACCDDKVQNGWYPLSGITKGDNQAAGQAFWRWAE